MILFKSSSLCMVFVFLLTLPAGQPVASPITLTISEQLEVAKAKNEILLNLIELQIQIRDSIQQANNLKDSAEYGSGGVQYAQDSAR
jgi:hypothetical protein